MSKQQSNVISLHQRSMTIWLTRVSRRYGHGTRATCRLIAILAMSGVDTFMLLRPSRPQANSAGHIHEFSTYRQMGASSSTRTGAVLNLSSWRLSLLLLKNII
jgi:hypothetical protein